MLPLPKLLGWRLAGIFTMLGVLVGVAAVFMVSFDVSRTSGYRCDPVPSWGPGASQDEVLATAQETALRFVQFAVLRQSEPCAFDLSGPDIRQDDKSADEWADGSFSVTPFVTSSPASVMSGARVVAQLEGVFRETEDGTIELPLYVGLADPSVGQQVFLLVLRLDRNRWVVDSWVPAGLAALKQQAEEAQG